MILASIPFINTAPFFHHLDPRWLKKHTLVSDSPRDLGRLAREGGVDAGLMSLVDLWQLQEEADWEPLGELGVAGEGAILSILLFGVKNPADLEGQAIAVSGQTSTSARLMDLWLKQVVGINHWTPVSLGQPSQGALLIADQALARRLSSGPNDPPPIDLCQAWTTWTGLPFVFARWAARRSLPKAEKKDLLSAVKNSLFKTLNDTTDTVRHLAATSGFPAPFLERYLSGIRYQLGEREHKGMALFKEKLETLERT